MDSQRLRAEEKTHAELGREYGLTKQRIKQIAGRRA
jgi:hypothetical protein